MNTWTVFVDADDEAIPLIQEGAEERRGVFPQVKIVDGSVLVNAIADSGEDAVDMVDMLLGDLGLYNQAGVDNRRVPISEVATGQGQGQGVGRQGTGGTDKCYCPGCGTSVTHERGVPCNETMCPKCNIPMTGVAPESESQEEDPDRLNEREIGPWRVVVEYDVSDLSNMNEVGEMDGEIENAAGKGSWASGSGFGGRDLEFDFESEEEAKEAHRAIEDFLVDTGVSHTVDLFFRDEHYESRDRLGEEELTLTELSKLRAELKDLDFHIEEALNSAMELRTKAHNLAEVYPELGELSDATEVTVEKIDRLYDDMTEEGGLPQLDDLFDKLEREL